MEHRDDASPDDQLIFPTTPSGRSLNRSTPSRCSPPKRANRSVSAADWVGRGADDPDIGPLINARAVEKQEAHVADALARIGGS